MTKQEIKAALDALERDGRVVKTGEFRNGRPVYALSEAAAREVEEKRGNGPLDTLLFPDNVFMKCGSEEDAQRIREALCDLPPKLNPLSIAITTLDYAMARGATEFNFESERYEH